MWSQFNLPSPLLQRLLLLAQGTHWQPKTASCTVCYNSSTCALWASSLMDTEVIAAAHTYTTRATQTDRAAAAAAGTSHDRRGGLIRITPSPRTNKYGILRFCVCRHTQSKQQGQGSTCQQRMDKPASSGNSQVNSSCGSRPQTFGLPCATQRTRHSISMQGNAQQTPVY